jgi:hypothetical protein
MGVLAVEVHEPIADLPKGRGGRHPAIYVRPRTTVSGHHTAQDHLPVTLGPPWNEEAPLDDGLGGTGSHEHGVGAAPEQQLDGLHDKSLAGAGLPSQGRHAGPEHEGQVLDHPQLRDPELAQHDAQSIVAAPVPPPGTSPRRLRRGPSPRCADRTLPTQTTGCHRSPANVPCPRTSDRSGGTCS